jgi:hypothetical protein
MGLEVLVKKAVEKGEEMANVVLRAEAVNEATEGPRRIEVKTNGNLITIETAWSS